MKFLVLPIISLLFLFSCSTSKDISDLNTDLSPQEIENKAEFFKETQFALLSEEDSLFASINKGFCFGTCPVYTINIYKSGFVTYNGTHNVDLKGEYSTMISYEKMLKFIEIAKRIEYMNMKDVYDNEGVTDLPSTTTSIVLNGKRKTVRRRFDFPPAIKVYEKVFEEMLSSENWEGIPVNE